LGKDDGVNFSITPGEKDFRTVVDHLDRHVDNRINRETRSQLRLKASLLRESQNRSEYLAFSAHFHLLVPAFLHLALADRPVDKPAKMPTLKFPRRAISSDLHPTGSVPFIMAPFHDQEEEYLSFNMHGDVPPPLLKTLYCFKRNTQ
jgi:hypothetical protein